VLFIFMFAPLWLLWQVKRGLPEPGPDRPPVDIISLAYNKTENIARLLRSVDVAAARYGGPVRVVVSDDGSTDETAEVAVPRPPMSAEPCRRERGAPSLMQR
jgi:cellulose synthase/poly-beta-1,6-N-acetylglucosamine synthase-like glycosyltransferase